jgi:hypothetical protein
MDLKFFAARRAAKSNRASTYPEFYFFPANLALHENLKTKIGNFTTGHRGKK